MEGNQALFSRPCGRAPRLLGGRALAWFLACILAALDVVRALVRSPRTGCLSRERLPPPLIVGFAFSRPPGVGRATRFARAALLGGARCVVLFDPSGLLARRWRQPAWCAPGAVRLLGPGDQVAALRRAARACGPARSPSPPCDALFIVGAPRLSGFPAVACQAAEVYLVHCPAGVQAGLEAYRCTVQRHGA